MMLTENIMEYLIAIIALVALGLSIAAIIKKCNCKDKFGDNEKCNCVAEFGTCSDKDISTCKQMITQNQCNTAQHVPKTGDCSWGPSPSPTPGCGKMGAYCDDAGDKPCCETGDLKHCFNNKPLICMDNSCACVE